jgi:hypothetical protein
VNRDWLPYFVNAREKTRKELFYIAMFCQKLSGTHINGLCFCALLSGRHYPRQFYVKIDKKLKSWLFAGEQGLKALPFSGSIKMKCCKAPMPSLSFFI